jgi:hypothetical protein
MEQSWHMSAHRAAHNVQSASVSLGTDTWYMCARAPAPEELNQRRVIKPELDGGYSSDHARSPSATRRSWSASARARSRQIQRSSVARSTFVRRINDLRHTGDNERNTIVMLYMSLRWRKSLIPLGSSPHPAASSAPNRRSAALRGHPLPETGCRTVRG